MHVKSDSEVTSVDASTPPRSPRRPLYYVQSPSQHDVEKMSYGSSPLGSPHHYHCSPIHHSRESSSTTRFSASIKNPRNLSTWKKIHTEFDHDLEEDDDDDLEDDYEKYPKDRVRFYAVCFVISFILLFSLFSLILWGASQSYKPKVYIKEITFDEFNLQPGNDYWGTPTEMVTLKSTVRMVYRNPATFFGVHVSATPFELRYYDLVVASGDMEEFYQSRKSQRKVKVNVNATMRPVYGGLSTRNTQLEKVVLPLNLTFVVRSRAYVLGKLVKPKFYRRIQCFVVLKGSRLGRNNTLIDACHYS